MFGSKVYFSGSSSHAAHRFEYDVENLAYQLLRFYYNEIKSGFANTGYYKF